MMGLERLVAAVELARACTCTHTHTHTVARVHSGKKGKLKALGIRRTAEFFCLRDPSPSIFITDTYTDIHAGVYFTVYLQLLGLPRQI